MSFVDVCAPVISNTRLSADYNVLAMAAPEIGQRAEPGQFVMVKAVGRGGPLLRRPFSIFEVLRDEGGAVRGISILNKRIGTATRLFYDASADDAIACLGPLGKPYTSVSPPREAWMVAGGVGLAPFATLAARLAARGTPMTLFYGARTGEELFYLDFFERAGARMVLSTEDGSRGTRARVTGPLQDALASLDAPDRVMVYGCGPEPMLDAVARLASRYRQPCEVSVERVMGCGLGGCYSCVIPTRGAGERVHLVRSCITGPVFDASQIAWDQDQHA